MSVTSSGRGAFATASSDPHAGPINVRAELEAIVRDPTTPSREKFAALKELARLNDEQNGPSEGVRLSLPGTSSIAISRQRDGRFSLWIRQPNAWVQEPNLPAEVVLYFVAARLFGPSVPHPEAETFEDALARLEESDAAPAVAAESAD